jgi:hypothetical protein
MLNRPAAGFTGPPPVCVSRPRLAKTHAQVNNGGIAETTPSSDADMSIRFTKDQILADLGIAAVNSGVAAAGQALQAGGASAPSLSPIDGAEIASVTNATSPAPKRGEIVRQLGEALREHKDSLGSARRARDGQDQGRGPRRSAGDDRHRDFAVGLSRQLYGRTMHSERPGPPDVRAVAPAGRGRHHQRVQLPGRGLGPGTRCSRRSAATADLEALARRRCAHGGARRRSAPPTA